MLGEFCFAGDEKDESCDKCELMSGVLSSLSREEQGLPLAVGHSNLCC